MPTSIALDVLRRNFTECSVDRLIDEASGQKLVAVCCDAGAPFILKLVELPTASSTAGQLPSDEVGRRLAREIGLLDTCASEHLPRSGPLAPGIRTIDGADFFYYSEEYIPGRNVRLEIQEDGTLATADVALMGIHVADALSTLWGLRVVHRDVKPANIVHDVQHGRFVLIDPGYALALAEPSITRLGMVVGTAPYYSPEHLDITNRRRIDVRADLYCLGVVMYEALTGEHPYFRPAMTWEETCGHVLHTQPAPPPVTDETASQLGAVIMRLLQKAPHLRYRSPRLVAEALQPLLGA